jgi:hypothetical protein
MTPRDADEEPNIERLIRSDRENLKSFVENLNKGVSFNEMDDDLKLWWLNRY